MKEFTAQHIAGLSAMVAPDRFSTGPSNRELHLRDISFHQGSLPAGIIWPVTTEEVPASGLPTKRCPVTPWGAGPAPGQLCRHARLGD
jgi:D-lactate dehydrogenase (cytochrome)